HSDPAVRATELLLQERIPRGVQAVHPRAEEVMTGRVVRTLTGLVTRSYDTADLPTPRTQILSNGTYSVMITTAGAGYSMSGSLAVTRWRADTTRDNWGSFVYVRDVRSGSVWSAGYQRPGPSCFQQSFRGDSILSITAGSASPKTSALNTRRGHLGISCDGRFHREHCRNPVRDRPLSLSGAGSYHRGPRRSHGGST